MITTEYLVQLRALHGAQQWGASGHSHAGVILDWARKTRSKTILDYGCGRGTLKPELEKRDPSLTVREYDPGILGKDAAPDPADLLVATDVLEHIEPEFLFETLTYLRGLALKAAYFTIALTPSKVSLPDGRNAHLLLLSKEQWLKNLDLAGFRMAHAVMRKGLWVWVR